MNLAEVEKFTLDDIVERERAAFGDFGPHHRYWLHQNAPQSVKKWLEKMSECKRLGLPPIMATRQGFAGMDYGDSMLADFPSRNTFTTEANIIGPAGSGAPTAAYINPNCLIPYSDCRAGKEWKLRITGTYNTTATPTIIFTPRWGSNVTIGTNVSLGASNTVTCGTVTTLPFWIEFDFTIRTIGIAGDSSTGKGIGFAVLTGTNVACGMGGTNATIDTSGSGTAGCGLQMGVTWGTSSGSNALIVTNYQIQSKN